MPQTFTLPHDYTDVVAAHMEAVRTDGGPCIWIVKPVGLSRGRGIHIIDDLSRLAYSEVVGHEARWITAATLGAFLFDPPLVCRSTWAQVIVQKYIKNPYLIDGYKFDLRLYVLVTSFQPLEAFVHREGFARMSTERYSLEDLSNRLIHLTNSSVQKLNVSGPSDDNPLKTASKVEAGGTKVRRHRVWLARATHERSLRQKSDQRPSLPSLLSRAAGR